MSDDPKYPSQLAERFQVRMPDGLRDRLRDAADANKRAMNTEIVSRLEDSFNPDSAAELRKIIEAQKRYVLVADRALEASKDSRDATSTVVEMYEQEVAALQKQLDRVAWIMKFVATAIGDGAKGDWGDFDNLMDSTHPFQEQSIADKPVSLINRQFDYGMARMHDVPEDDRPAAYAKLVSTLVDTAELLGVEWAPPSWKDDIE